MGALIFTVYALGILTILSFIVFVVLLFGYIRASRMVPLTQDVHDGNVNPDELQALDVADLVNTLTGLIKATSKLARALDRAKPVAIAAVAMILFLLVWLVAMTLLVATQLAGHT